MFKKKLITIVAIIMLLGVGSVLASYSTSGSFTSTNLLSGIPTLSIDSFVYNLSSEPAGTEATIQFSQNSSSWYNSSGTLGGTNALSTGTNNTISLSSLGWSGANFYYKVTYTSDGSGTPVLNDITLNYSPAVAPTVTTQDPSNVATTTATGNGNITATGGDVITRRGFCYVTGTSGDPTTSDSVAYDDGSFGTGAYTIAITGLSAATNYRVRAYAVSSIGTSYGTTVQMLTTPLAPTGVSATDGTYTDKVTITWTKSTGATNYHVWRDSTDLGATGDVATFDDATATAGVITPGAAAASDGTSVAFVSLSLSGQSTSTGSSYTYKVVASNSTGNSPDSTTDTGYRRVGTLTYQWQRSSVDADSSYSNISGATAVSYNDTGAPADGSGRYFRCLVDAAGAVQQISTANRGYRIVGPPSITTSAASFITETKATLNGNVTSIGGVEPTVTVYWGDNDGGTTASSWDNNSVPSTPSQPQGVAAFTKDLTSLTNNTYYFSAKATNSGGTVWGTSRSFVIGPYDACGQTIDGGAYGTTTTECLYDITCTGASDTITVNCSDLDGNMTYCNVVSPCANQCPSGDGSSGTCSCEYTCPGSDNEEPNQITTVQMTVTWAGGCSYVIEIPSFNWTYSDPDNDPVGTDPQTAYQIRIDNDSTFDVDGNDDPVLDADEFRCSETVCSGGASPSYSPTAAAWIDWADFGTTYYWKIRVKDSNNAWSSWSNTDSFISSVHTSPSPAFTHDPESPSVDQEVLFIDSSVCYDSSNVQYSCSSGSSRYLWGFGDGATCDSNTNPACRGNATHTYSEISDYTITLEVTDDVGTCSTQGDTPMGTSIPLPDYQEVPPTSMIKDFFADVLTFLKKFSSIAFK